MPIEDPSRGGPRTLGELFLASAAAHPDRPALWVDGETLSYAALRSRAAALAGSIERVDDGGTGLVAILGGRSATTYAALLAALLAGRGYVPLGRSYPAERNLGILERSGAATVLCDRRCERALDEILERAPGPPTAILAERGAAPARAGGGRARVLATAPPDREVPPPEVAADGRSIAYLLFTSGSTGKPKGIAIPHASALAYLAAAAERYGLGPDDRVSQNFELTFDLSVHDLFAAWGAGACVVVPGERLAMAPAALIRDHGLTSWFSTPSTARMMMHLRLLAPGAFPSLRWSLFCGEPLPLEIARAWQAAAPGSAVDNLYGPTEATIACTAYRFSPADSPAECVHGIVPIGWPLGDTRCAIAGGKGGAGAETGELLIAGPQVAPGYWRDPDLTAERFVAPSGPPGPGPWYRTGDLVSRGARGALVYRGRTDHQVKVLGHRVELQEIEAVVRAVSGAGEVAALAWPRTVEGASGVIVYLAGGGATDREILDGCRRRLPPYMVPREIHRLSALPLTANRKLDRDRLRELREAAG